MSFTNTGQSDSIKAQQLLGQALSTLHAINFLDSLLNDLALVNNPEPLKIEFTENDVDALSKLMHGNEFRLSASFKVGPVMIVPSTPVPPALLPAMTGIEHLPITPSIGPQVHGHLLGGPNDNILVEIYQQTTMVFHTDVIGLTDQTELDVQIPHYIVLPDGCYQIIVRVNGAQAPHSPLIDWV